MEMTAREDGVYGACEQHRTLPGKQALPCRLGGTCNPESKHTRQCGMVDKHICGNIKKHLVGGLGERGEQEVMMWRCRVFSVLSQYGYMEKHVGQ